MAEGISQAVGVRSRTGRAAWRLIAFLLPLLLLEAGCATSTVCDRTCLTEGNEETLYLHRKDGTTLVLFEGLYTVALTGDSGTITGRGYVPGKLAPGEPLIWEGTISLNDIDSVSTQHVSLQATLGGCSIFLSPFIAGGLVKLILGL